MICRATLFSRTHQASANAEGTVCLHGEGLAYCVMSKTTYLEPSTRVLSLVQIRTHADRPARILVPLWATSASAPVSNAREELVIALVDAQSLLDNGKGNRPV